MKIEEKIEKYLNEGRSNGKETAKNQYVHKKSGMIIGKVGKKKKKGAVINPDSGETVATYDDLETAKKEFNTKK